MMIDAARYASVGELLRDAFVQFKSSTALVEIDRKRERARLSYADASREAAKVAAYFERIDVGAESRVAIVLSNQSKYPLAAYAAFTRGAVIIPIDYKLTAKERLQLLAHAKPRVVVTEMSLFQKELTEAVPNVLLVDAPDGRDVGGAVRWEELDAPSETPAFVPRAREDIATIVYSSGTGGTPKGCMLSHGAYLSQYSLLSKRYPMVEGDRYFSILPTNHAIDFMCGFIGPFAGGATVVHQRTLRPEFLVETMKSQRITHMAVVPMILAAFERAIREKLDALPPWKKLAFEAAANLNASLTEKAPRPEVSRKLLAQIHDAFGGELRFLFCGGAFLERERAEFFYRLGIPVAIGYGLTEACTVATVNDLKPFRGDSVGSAIDGVTVRIVNADEFGVGEVEVRGPTLMTGYLDEPELTAAAFTEDGFLRTGDLGYLDGAHHLHLVGRRKNMIVTEGGKNVYPEDIEAAFVDVPSEEACVFAANYVWPKQTMVGERLVLVARVKDGQNAAFLDAVRAKNQRLADYKRIHGVLFAHGDFPRTASMKVKREELARGLRASAREEEVVAL